MENNQSIKHELTQETRHTAVLKSSKSVAISSYKIFIYLLTRHPLLLLAGIFTTLMGSAGMALYSLVHVGDVEHLEAEPVAVIEQPIIADAENGNPLPLWMVAAIALSCASGCLIIFRLLNQPTQRPKIQKREAISHQALSASSRTQKQQQPILKTQPMFVPRPTLQPVNAMQATKKPLLTVLPAEQRSPFDDSKESLVELLDWRKHNSLTAILQQYSS
ncbi:conserved hypothetical protein [Trichormus variabilis ATCC 29413]|uniref:Uncharacterized protein n=2 Tax=Anabaena variabilis TaxID=264691 RepID=Q3MG99_TRIV2|nr:MULTISPECIES: hypothetical protein [Nostocaceae]ABA19987.1 conserved hypothetical protein [Trichormus variabilis ATCC 29413]